jgi:hypothetical protein
MQPVAAEKVVKSSTPVRVTLADLNVIQDRGRIVWLGNEMHAVLEDGLLHRLIVQTGYVRRRR